MGILDLFKKKQKVSELPVADLPPLPTESLSPLTPNSSSESLDVADAVAQAQKLSSPLSTPPAQDTPLDALPAFPDSADELPALDELSTMNATEQVSSQTIEPSATEPTVDPVEIPVENPKAPSFEIPSDYADLLPEEIFINRPQYIELLGNLDILKQELISENKAAISNQKYFELLKSGIQQSLDAEASLSKMEEHLLF